MHLLPASQSGRSLRRTGHCRNMIKNIFSRFVSWNGFLAVMFAGVLFYATISVPHFASAFNLSQAAAGVSEKAILLLPMALLIIAREIDLSVASILALDGSAQDIWWNVQD